MKIRFANQRGNASLAWLNSYHTFSFGHYYDAEFMGHGPLRVINEDWIKGAAGFPTHGHADMEIITYVVEGELKHQDSNGNSSVIRPGEVQKMSAGVGIKHSEYNASQHDDVHLLQIWIEPDKKGVPSGYQQKAFPSVLSPASGLTLLLSPDGQQGSMTIEQQAWVFGGKIRDNSDIKHLLKDKHIGWLQVVKGQIALNGQALNAGDGASFEKGEQIVITQTRDAEILLFEMEE